MAVIAVKPYSVTWNSAACSGCASATLARETEFVEDTTDGAVGYRKAATQQSRHTITLNFLYHGSGFAKFTVAQDAVLVVVLKDGLGASNATYTYTNAQVRSVTTDGNGGGVTVTLQGSSPAAGTDPLVVS